MDIQFVFPVSQFLNEDLTAENAKSLTRLVVDQLAYKMVPYLLHYFGYMD
jgi:hypothetical protein